ncbi:MAG TPA: heme-binding domain-containing protein [Candidatus Angelobacter sp.]|nr:heme-binding domain-containing protein [Candidatus Angelobacter sp.]
MKRVMVWLGGILIALVVMSLVLGLAHPFGNPRATTTVATDEPSTLLLEHALMPVEVRSVLRQKCGDCHSTHTQWRWYARFAPVSWLIEKDITEAQEQMNLSQWESLPDEDILRLRTEIAGVTRAHAMPPIQYRVAHSDVAITDDDIRLLRDWSRGDVASKLGEPETTPSDAGSGDAGHGQQVFASRCAGCHTLEQHQEGPKLAGIFGRTSGTAPGFIYSFALKKASVKWDEQSLDKWLANPDAVVPMNNMYFHVAKASQRRDLIAYLKASGN